jgi:hypothetical protein
MADSPDNRGGQDRTRININQEHEVRYWTEKFRVTEEQLRQAVQRVGVMVEDVEKELKQAGRSR